MTAPSDATRYPRGAGPFPKIPKHAEKEKNKDKDMIQNIRNLVAGPGWRKQREFLGTDEMPTFLVTQEN